MSNEKLTAEAELERLQLETFSYFLHETNPKNGLVLDKTAPNWPSSIAATGLALASYPVGVERGFITRDSAIETVLTTLRFLLLATMVFIIISLTWRQVGAPGIVNCRL